MPKSDSESISHRPAIALVGNPGAGKSTLLNGLVGSPQFKSGPNLNGCLTQVLQEYSVGNLTLYDTPGLLDVMTRGQAVQELNKLLSKNVALKIAFVVTLDEGRVRMNDVLTIKLVLDAISVDTTNRFGVIINKMGDPVKAMMREDSEAECTTRETLTGDHKTSHWCYVSLKKYLLGASDQCYTTRELGHLFFGLPVTKPLDTVVSNVDIQNLEELLAALELGGHADETSTGVEFGGDVESADSDSTSSIEQDNDVNAMYVDARRFLYGRDGVPANPARAVKLVNRAMSKGGHVVMMHRLALLLRHGTPGLRADPSLAVEAYELAIRHDGCTGAIIGLAEMLQDGAEGVPANAPRSVELYTQLMKQYNDLEAIYDLGLLLQYGAEGVCRDPKRASKLFTRAIKEAGHKTSWYSVRHLLPAGVEGLPGDPDSVVEVSIRAVAMFSLGNLLRLDRDGVSANPSRAQKLLTRARTEIKIEVIDLTKDF